MSKRKIALTGALAVAALAIAGQAMAALPFTASTNMQTLAMAGQNFDISKIGNGNTTTMDGFAATGKTGTITLELQRCGTVRSFMLYNNINATQNGVKTFELKFFGEHGTLLGSKTVTVNNGAAPQTVMVNGSTGFQFVHTVEMNITASFDDRAEIREIVLDGEPGECCP